MIIIYANDSLGRGYGPWACYAARNDRVVDILTDTRTLALTECVWIVPGSLDLA